MGGQTWEPGRTEPVAWKAEIEDERKGHPKKRKEYESKGKDKLRCETNFDSDSSLSLIDSFKSFLGGDEMERCENEVRKGGRKGAWERCWNNAKKVVVRNDERKRVCGVCARAHTHGKQAHHTNPWVVED